MSDWDEIYKCPACGNTDCVPPHNPSNSKILIVGDYPEGDDILQGVPFVSRVGTIMKQQLARLGYDLSQFCVCNLWQHAPDRIVKKMPIYNNPKCTEYGKKIVITEAKKKKLILLVGSNVTKTFLAKNVSELNGMIVNDYLKFDFSAPVVMAMYKPSIVFHGCAGEVILALKNFTKEAKKL